jgi:Uma2 family endonuclease
MTQEEFHRSYCAMPDGYRAELIGGIVFEPSPLGLDHGDGHSLLGGAFLHYAARTPGLHTTNNVTVILSNQDEVQPDLLLRVRPECGGQSEDTVLTKPTAEEPQARYILGAPELVAEIAHTSKAIDLHLKKKRYTHGGVLEYVVVCLYPERLNWFDLRKGKVISAGNDGIFRSRIFPGLWIDNKALLDGDYAQLMDTIEAGMQTAEYKSFSANLAQAKK